MQRKGAGTLGQAGGTSLGTHGVRGRLWKIGAPEPAPATQRTRAKASKSLVRPCVRWPPVQLPGQTTHCRCGARPLALQLVWQVLLGSRCVRLLLLLLLLLLLVPRAAAATFTCWQSGPR